MERAGLKTLQSVASPLHFRARSSLFPPFLLPKVVVHNLHPPHLYSSSRLSTLHSLCIRSDAKPLPNGAECGDAAAQHKLLQVVLVSPQIPGNTGSIARTCAASAVGLHLVEPLGFPIDNTKLKRAGLDYWPYPFSSSLVANFHTVFGLGGCSCAIYVVVKVHQSWDEFREYFRGQAGEKRLLAFTKRGTTTHSKVDLKLFEGSCLEGPTISWNLQT
ncbi:uncharacterized protein LOC107838941 isoform X3 [Capsicum annuum]|uniref:uncharacterized protein LOC107838941 isoform X3 n=1 Tax=Capsicum annuum TaxID=4072 RepID=UPI001FB0F389|nr:uncharacterized protein LOC107838941 isoform X3 [Capsicum annuum]